MSNLNCDKLIREFEATTEQKAKEKKERDELKMRVEDLTVKIAG